MSLVVWLPLNGNLENQGLSNVTVTNNGATVDNNGKIGKCYKFNNQYITIPITNLNTTNGLTLSCWVYPTANASGNMHLVTFAPGAGWPYNRFGLFLRSGTTSIITTASDGTNTINYNCQSSALPLNTWTHVCSTYSNRKLTVYLNGVQNITYNITFDISLNGIDSLNVGGCKNGNETLANCKLNDVRFYNHCLSAKEVGELAKGLVLHYRLAGPGGMNMISDFDTSFNTIAVGEITIFENQMNGGTQEVLSSFANKNKVVHFHSNGGSDRMYRYYTVTKGKSYTVSFDYYSTSTHTRALHCELNGGNYNWLASDCAYSTPGVWKRLSTTYINITSNATLFIFIMCNANTDCYIKNIKLEEGSVATPWCPNPADALYAAMGYNNNIEYDCSGYRRNGTKSGNIAWDIDSPRYTTSYKFTAGSTISTSTGFPIGTNPRFTINFWFNPPSNFTYTSYADVCGLHCTTTGYPDTWCRLEACGSPAGSAWSWFRGFQPTSSNLPVENIAQDAWNMITLVSDGTKMYTYTNGVNTRTINITEWQPNGDFILGDGAGGISGKYSDLRIYATALSAEDIAELYHSAVIVDNTGKSYAYEYFEAN